MRRLLTALVATLTLGSPVLAAEPPKVGDPAPAFSLPSDRDETVSLSQFKGQKIVVLAFYPKDETPGCTKEMQAFSQDQDKFTAAGAAVFGISVDSVKSHKAFALNCALSVPLLSDEGGKVAEAYGAKMPLIGIAQRKTFVIDQAGIVRHVVDGMPDNAKLLDEIKRLNRVK